MTSDRKRVPEVDDIVAFTDGMKNARGYPLTGKVNSKTEDLYTVCAWGLVGPGSETQIHGVPASVIEVCTAIEGTPQ